MEIIRIDYDDTKDFILNKHYAQRLPNIKWAFGLYIDDQLEGVVTFGKPASHQLCIGICGEENSDKVYELNRLIVNEGLPPNTLSIFLSRALRLLKSEDLIIVSYSDMAMNHHGYIYQATNFVYTGSTKERTDIYTGKNKHSRHYETIGSLRKVRSSKHRYVYFTGKSRKKYMRELRYETQPYPKGENSRYELGTRIKTKIIDTKTGKTYFE